MSDENENKQETPRLIKKTQSIIPQEKVKEEPKKVEKAPLKKIKVSLKKHPSEAKPQDEKKAEGTQKKAEVKEEASVSATVKKPDDTDKLSSSLKRPVINKDTSSLPPLKDKENAEKSSSEAKSQSEKTSDGAKKDASALSEVKTAENKEAKQNEKTVSKETVSQKPQSSDIKTKLDEKKAEVKVTEMPGSSLKSDAKAHEKDASKPSEKQDAKKKDASIAQKNKPSETGQKDQKKPNQVNASKPQQAQKKDAKDTHLSSSLRRSPIIIRNEDMPPIYKDKPQPKSTGPIGQMGAKRREEKNAVPKGFVRSNIRDKKPFGKKKEGLPPPRTPRLGQVSSAFKNSSAFPSPDKNAHRKNYAPKKDAYSREDNKEHDFEITRKSKTSSLDNVPKKIDIMSTITVGELARKMNLKASEIITKLFALGVMASINEQIDSDTATIIASEYGCDVHIVDLYEETVIENEESKEENLIARAPIVTVMGHVDHGKTKLLDAIRNSDVTSGEFGGITQHIGAYKIKLKKSGKELVFIDTPGHAAFTMMRARGAKVTDVVILVVAATEGVMPQTVEAIDHAKAANVPIVVALNKCDLESANPDRVMTELSEYGLTPEEWGGNTQYCKISALKKEGIYELLEAVIVQSEILELKADPTLRAKGTVLEAKIDQGRGVVATVLVQEGTLHKDDNFVAGIYSGHVRAMLNDKGEKITEAGPSTPVEITGMDTVPSAGDPFQVTENEKVARTISTKRQELERQGQSKKYQRVTLDNVYDKIKEGEAQEFNVIIKGDVQGSVEALSTALMKLSTPKVRLNVLLARAGAIIENDVNLAIASSGGALIIGFNVRPTPKAAALAESEKIEIRKYNVIYDVVDDVKSAMEGLLSPVKKESQIGTLEVRDTFRVPNVGIVAGCMVTSGKIKRKSYLKVVRDNIQISNGLVKLSSLKRFKNDAAEVAEGFECGVGLENFQDIKIGDILEAYEIIEEKQHLDIPNEII